jgi:DNA-binding NarL/FixJ family response regulator
MDTPTRLVIYEDNPELRASLGELLAGTPGLELVGAFGNCTQAGDDMRRLRPHVVLMDIDMPGCSGIDGLRYVKAVAPATNVLMLTVFEDNDRVFDAICAGADGYLLKKTPPARLLEAIGEVRAGGAPMTPAVARQVLRLFPKPASSVVRAAPVPTESLAHLSAREQEVLTLLVKGYSYKMIAADRQISIDTVRSHIKKIYEKLHVRSMTEAVSKAMREGLA